MVDRSQPISRRGLFAALVRPITQRLNPQEPAEDTRPQQAIIQGRYCLAYQGGICFTCSERCPELGAITTEKGIPTVHADLCTGCGICHDLCPAPRNAILMLAKPNNTPE